MVKLTLLTVVLIPMATVIGTNHVIAASITVPVFYAMCTKIWDFYARWEQKGREHPGKYSIWTDGGGKWSVQPGDVDTIVSLHRGGARVAAIERPVRLRDGNPYSLGLDLTAGAIAVDVTSAIVGQGGPAYLGLAFAIHSRCNGSKRVNDNDLHNP